jgi:PAS domain S-box-containing protein
MQTDSQLFAALVNQSLDGIQVLSAIRSTDGEVIDFVYTFSNPVAEKIYGDLLDVTLLATHPGLFIFIKDVFTTGMPYQREYHYGAVWYQLSIVRLTDAVSVTSHGITDQKMSAIEAVINVSEIAMGKLNAIRNTAGEVADFEYEWLNEAAIGLSFDATGMRLLPTFPGTIDNGIFDLMVKTTETGIPTELEVHYNKEGYDRYLYYRFVRLKDGIMFSCEDIAGRKKAEAEVLLLKDALAQQVEDKYLTLFNNMIQGFCIIEVLFDGNGQGCDYIFLEANPVFEQQTGLLNVVGRKVSDLVPAHEKYWFTTYGEVVRSRESIHFENEASQLKGGIWYDVFAFPYGAPENNQVAIFFNDITDRKRDQRRQAFLLELADTLRPITDPAVIETTTCNMLEAFLTTGIAYYEEDSRELPSLRKGEAIVLNNPTGMVSVGLEKGVLCVKENGPREWSAAEVDLVRDTGDRMHAAMERAIAEKALSASQARLHSLANLVPDLLWDSEPDGYTLWHNQRWLEYTGQTFGQAAGWGWLDAIHPDDRETFSIQYREGKAFRQESRIRSHRGEYRWFIVNASPQITENGEVLKMYGAATDVHEVRLTMEALVKSEALLASVFHVSPIGLAYTDLNGQILLLNDEMKRFLPSAFIPSKDDSRYNKWVAYHPDGSVVDRNDYPGLRALRGDPVLPYLEMLYTGDDGRETWTRVASIPLRDDKNNITGAVSVITDINELKTKEQQLKELLKQKDVFIGMASHELKTPVTSMKVYAELVQERLSMTGDTENTALLHRLNKQIDRLTALINTLLDTTSLAEGRLYLSIKTFDLHALLRECVAEMQLKNSHQIVLHLDPLPLIQADRERITQVVMNLVSNAIKYSPNGSVITVTGRTKGGYVEVGVKDEGEGIQAEDQARIFDRFFRVTAHRSGSYPGMGLGLYISAQIIERHKGKIWVESEPGKGSAFYFTIPEKD